MKTFITDLIPKLQRFSQQLDDLTLLMNHHWVLIDEIQNSKNVYIFRPNNELLISNNSRVEKARWEYLGHNSLLLELKEGAFLFKNGFVDSNFLALKADSRDEFAIFINESKHSQEFNSLEAISNFIRTHYLSQSVPKSVEFLSQGNDAIESEDYTISEFRTSAGLFEVLIHRKERRIGPAYGDRVLLNGLPCPDGKYKLSFGWYLVSKNGHIVSMPLW